MLYKVFAQQALKQLYTPLQELEQLSMPSSLKDNSKV